jgi:SAM-dependent methyltransferase
MTTTLKAADGLICARCKKNIVLLPGVDSIKCHGCDQVYPVIQNIPIIINEDESIFSFGDFINHKNLFFDISKKGKLIAFISKITPGTGGSNLGKSNFRFLEDLLLKSNQHPRVLVVGGSIIGDGMHDFVESPNLDIVEGDVSHGPRTKIIFDAHTIPYASERFDCVIVQAVLEHVMDPIRCVAEIYRVLKPGGVVYAETPFMQQVHGGPYDFTRFTRSGHRRLFRNFKEVKSGATAGSGTALAWSYEYFMMSLFGHGKMLRLMVKFFARLTGFWIKYFDYITRLNTRDTDGASGFYFMGEKSPEVISDKSIIQYYR